MESENKSNALTRGRLSEIIQQRYGNVLDLPKYRYMNVVDGLFDEICTTLIRGESVKILSFGSFFVNHKKERLGRNPKTGETEKIDERRVITFSPSHHLKSRTYSKKG